MNNKYMYPVCNVFKTLSMYEHHSIFSSSDVKIYRDESPCLSDLEFIST